MLRNVFGHITVMPHLHNAGEALALLTRLARIVEPIMISRGLFVEHLTEFLPQPEERLLGRNYGQGWWICIGLRKNNHRGINQFRPEEDLLGTLLHELTHNLFGRHGADFHGYLKGLKDQYYLLMSLQGDDRQPERQGDGRHHQDHDHGHGRRPQALGGWDHHREHPRAGGRAPPVLPPAAAAPPRRGPPGRRPGYGGGNNPATINNPPQVRMPNEPIDGRGFVGDGRRLGGHFQVPSDADEEWLRIARLHRLG